MKNRKSNIIFFNTICILALVGAPFEMFASTGSEESDSYLTAKVRFDYENGMGTVSLTARQAIRLFWEHNWCERHPFMLRLRDSDGVLILNDSVVDEYKDWHGHVPHFFTRSVGIEFDLQSLNLDDLKRIDNEKEYGKLHPLRYGPDMGEIKLSTGETVLFTFRFENYYELDSLQKHVDKGISEIAVAFYLGVDDLRGDKKSRSRYRFESEWIPYNPKSVNEWIIMNVALTGHSIEHDGTYPPKRHIRKEATDNMN